MYGDGDIQFVRGMIIPESGGPFIFQWNPAEFNEGKQVKYLHIPVAGRKHHVQQYGCGEPQTYYVFFPVIRV